MNLKYNEVDKTIEVKDGLKTHLFLMKFLMIVTLTNSMLNLSDVVTSTFGYVTIIWLILGVVAGGFLYHFIFKRTGLEKIPADQIQGFNERVSSGRKKYSLSLKNGKTRDLPEVKTAEEAKKVTTMLKKNGVLV
ncbi:hypothetical protein [Flavobacterium muglaense]|uniref:Uncharacterized protein n=1 Tax=Flavobacterium muglaense TaxID=2764716 RepID=A0A923SGF3_9FLAO|nr:hypothetical protein [Flavobacterium muglaense]MBC5839013.1 hypothetical protein [Flavobacterium muglaense]MBC5845515.1 hypothetical protein [Flavobacterium muglaense]